MTKIKETVLASELTKIDVTEKLSACPIDFSKSRVANPRADQKQKNYDNQPVKSNFNERKKYELSQAPQFNQLFTDGTLAVKPGKYRLIWSKHCPWATRIAIAIDLLGLDEVISKGVVDPLRPAGVVGDWFFTLDENNEDPVLHIKALSESYLQADPTYKIRTTVPALVDVETGKVINNNYNTLIDELAIAWKEYQAPQAPDVYPEDLQADIDALNKILYTDINAAVNEAGLARSQADYEKYYDRVFNRLDWLEERLNNQRYLFGNQITDSDIRLFVTLVRFDTVFYQKYYVNKKRLVDYPNLWNYAKDLYSLPAFKNNTDFDAIKKRFYQVDHTPISDLKRIIPKGPDLSIWEEPNDRNRFE
ncbi:glutathione S-transferase C-terminal domain-containing protein [Liquorilactobacillus oeni]|uniref:Glutathione S-transferase n=1 Tax=Liquorilactobacillus oeni DSM 19972 TaxID=1423777 RepID=A0A0R1MAH7_9LACO|nr:glutathione S-transferase C-terminal domain-containing protein [Liquorilactobacillus oeni]KRL05341.1 glutathione S-transferase [Liquorilactobacillus oeni DSM 19972]